MVCILALTFFRVNNNFTEKRKKLRKSERNEYKKKGKIIYF